MVNKNTIFIIGAVGAVFILIGVAVFLDRMGDSQEKGNSSIGRHIEQNSVAIPLREADEAFIAETGSDPEETENVVIVNSGFFDRNKSTYTVRKDEPINIYFLNQDNEIREIVIDSSPEGSQMPMFFQLQPTQKLHIELIIPGTYKFRTGGSEFELEIIQS